MEEIRSRKWMVLLTVSLGLFMALLDATIVNIAVPAIMTEMEAGVTRVSWVLNAYNLGLLALILAVGRLSDRVGQKRVFLAGLTLFTGFSLACGLAPSIDWLILFRVGQSVGAAALIPVSLSILLGVFPARQHGLATGLWGGIGAVAAALGPTIGGALTQYASWNWIFFVNVPIGAAGIAFVLTFVPEHRRATRGGLDPLGIGLSAAGIFALTLEKIPAELARRVTAELEVPTIGIGAGPDCDGQVLVTYDLLGLFEEFRPRFVRRYAELGESVRDACRRYGEDVRAGKFPGPQESY